MQWRALHPVKPNGDDSGVWCKREAVAFRAFVIVVLSSVIDFFFFNVQDNCPLLQVGSLFQHIGEKTHYVERVQNLHVPCKITAQIK